MFSVDHSDYHCSNIDGFAVTHDPSRLVHFGAGIPDLRIDHNCNKNTVSVSEFGFNYNLPKDMILRSKEAREYFAGSMNFRVKEIEIFSIKI